MRFRQDIESGLRDAASLDEKVNIAIELLLDVRNLLLAIPPESFERALQRTHDAAVSEDVFNKSVEDLPFSARTLSAFSYGNIKTLRDLMGLTKRDLMQLRNMGQKSVNEIQALVAPYGIKIGGL